MKPSTTRIALAGLCACVFVQAFFSLRQKSLTYDELSYIPAGYSYVVTGDFRLNHEQPPLMKLLAGAGMLPLRPRLPVEHASWAAAGEGDLNTQWDFGREFLLRANPNGERLVLFARIPTVLVTMLLVVGVFVFARDLYGPAAGLLAATLCAFDPNILAHGRLATTDLGLACFTLLAVWAYRRLIRKPAMGTLLAAGALLGLALLAKFSGLFLLALYPLWALALPWVPGAVSVPRQIAGRPVPRGPMSRLGTSVALCAGVIAVALLVVSLGYLAPFRADLYFRDFLAVNVNVDLRFQTYFHGAFTEGRIPWYFVAAFLLKTPLALLLLLGLRAASRIRHGGEGWDVGILLLSPVVIWFVIISWKAFQIGIRYVLPVYPFLFVLTSGIVASPWFRRRGVRVAVAGLVAWGIGSSLATYPHYLPYFNELAGGPSRGIEWLDDSNVDWGQDLILLRRFLRDNGIHDARITGMARYDPALYGVPGFDLPPHEAVGILSNPAPPPAVYAVSAHLLNRAKLSPGPVDPLKDLQPVAVLGHTIYVFDLR
ncbi:MAG: glycosyl transferase [Gemmatimonadota bacterium]